MAAVAHARKSNFEIMRIVAIVMIISFHCVYKAGWDTATMPLWNRLVCDAFTMFGEMGVNLFVLVSGFFLVKSRFSWKKLALLCLEVMFYNYLSLLILAKFDFAVFASSIVVNDVFPTLFIRYWFISSYALLYLFSPFLAKGLRALETSEMTRLIAVMLCVWCALPTFMALTIETNNTEGWLFYSRFIWMIVLFALGAFVSLHEADFKHLQHKSSRYFSLAASVYLALVLFMLVAEMHPHFFASIGIVKPSFLWPPNTITTLAISFLLFMGFQKLDVPQSRLVNRIASTTLGIYLLHDGKLQTMIWHDMLDTASHAGSPWLIAWILAETVLVFLVGVAVDLIRQILEKPIRGALDNLSAKRSCPEKNSGS